jgi:hypothetical protein
VGLQAGVTNTGLSRRLYQQSPFFLPDDQVSLASLGDFPPASFCVLRHAAGGMPNWLMNHRVNELAMEYPSMSAMRLSE